MADAVESGGGRAVLVSELGRVQDLVRQLEQHLRAPADAAASVDLCRALVRQIVALTDRSMGMLRAAPDLAAALSPPLSATGTGSPISSSDGAASDHLHPFRGAAGASPKKRKATARWTSQQVRVGAAGEGPADDGHSWRKYGQKDILGARHPRAYYRCTHRNSQNCPATKQVQRADDHPTLFDVVYHGQHTCRPGAAAGGGGGAKRQAQQHNPHAQAALQGLAARLTVATTTDAVAAAPALPPPMTPESCPVRTASSPWSLASPVGSDSNGCLQQGVSPCPVSAYRDWASEGDLQEVVSSAFAAAALPVLDDEFMSLECFAFDQNFDIDAAMPSLYYP